MYSLFERIETNSKLNPCNGAILQQLPVTNPVKKSHSIYRHSGFHITHIAVCNVASH